ncbi:FAD/NAD(P)-binding domain-containing protein [Gonapodya prolifera JEL478]|uniref:FAD/NAD(P)-binding domain-containing protein n=1 Tax=Gonapodya prolifera (strain JEL478) TaxID=1344416 RepID=A0A139B0F8_GONPJ|nr:FAD/NAD(P)-binding domain-containing protein [Gonapodya prolifera JEL478]|eukprot:KXS22293.1 FAD/NAD(P)-binding domain-containing protein [Gonapodya prolifera JEL478]
MRIPRNVYRAPLLPSALSSPSHFNAVNRTAARFFEPRPVWPRIACETARGVVRPFSSTVDQSSGGPKDQALWFAIVGSGPAGFYTADKLLSNFPNARVDIFEKLPFPYGLARYGVAPDHPEVKNVVNKFDSIASSPRVRFFGSVTFPTHIDLPTLRSLYDATVLSYGASLDRRLGIPGEDARGVLSARDFVAWYNGLPGFQNLNPRLEDTDHVAIVGHGNVALDVARMLLAPVEWLAKTDMTQYAIETFARSRVRRVTLIGRRGPLQVSFTAKELREMLTLPSAQFLVDVPLLRREIEQGSELLDRDRARKRLLSILTRGLEDASSVSTKRTRARAGAAVADGSAAELAPNLPTPNTAAARSWELKFWRTPKAVLTSADGAVVGLELQVTRPDGPPERPRALPTGETDVVECGMLVKSVGYRSEKLPGVPYDEERGCVPNVKGRVIQGADPTIPTPFLEYLPAPAPPSGPPPTPLYVSGWLKRGPTGVIASTLADAHETAQSVVEDVIAGTVRARTERGAGTVESVGDLLRAKGARPVSFSEWKVVEREEERKGAERGKVREKLTDVGEVWKPLAPGRKACVAMTLPHEVDHFLPRQAVKGLRTTFKEIEAGTRSPTGESGAASVILKRSKGRNLTVAPVCVMWGGGRDGKMNNSFWDSGK